jgi:1,4-dihydroxy-2-naphthoate octaprenyltransferase
MALPIFLGAAIAWSRTGQFDFGMFALALVGGVFMQAGTTMANEYFDEGPREDEEVGWQFLPPQQVLQGAVAFFVVGSMIGLYLAALTGPAVLFLGLVGLLSGYTYSAPPLRLSGTGVGELLAGLNLGVLTTLGSYYVQVYRLSWEPVVAALPVALLMASSLALHGFEPRKIQTLDHRTIWARLGPGAAPVVYGAMATVAFILLVAGVVRKLLPPETLIAVLGLPAAVVAFLAAGQARFRWAVRTAVITHLSVSGLLVVAYLLHGMFRGPS